MNKRMWLIISSVVAGTAVWFMLAQSVAMQPQATVSGTVIDTDTGLPIEGATVRVQATDNYTVTAADGSFTLSGLADGVQVRLTASKEGYLIEGGAWATPPQTGITITIRQYYAEDNPDYVWFSSSDPGHAMSCMHCMVPHTQWVNNAHANSAVSPRFFSIYNGTYLTTTTIISPGYKLDFPGTPGNCATCHAPAAVVAGVPTTMTHTTTVTGSFSADMNTLSGVELEGSFCEFCHKIGEVYLNTDGLPYDDRPGVLSTRLYRSPPDWVLWFGPLDDVTRRVSYLELEKKSQFCAPCHQASFNGTPIYESFDEWLNSPYPAQGIECQTCHMAPTGIDYFAFPEKGGLTRIPDTMASHLQPGASDETLLQNTVSMTLLAWQQDGQFHVTVTISNTGAGHHVPTDHPGRHMILTVAAERGQGQALPQLGGPTVPDWGGAQAGLPGKAFAKTLQDEETGESPVISYWKPVTITLDNRIPAMGSDTSAYTFTLPATGGPITVTAELRFRRLYQNLMVDKGWPTPDIVMEESTELWRSYYLPIVQREDE